MRDANIKWIWIIFGLIALVSGRASAAVVPSEPEISIISEFASPEETVNILLTNESLGTLSYQNAVISGECSEEMTITSITPQWNIETGTTVTATLRWIPTQTGTYRNTIEFYFLNQNIVVETCSVTVVAHKRPAVMGTIDPFPSPLDLGTMYINEPNLVGEISLLNNANMDVRVTSFEFTGTDADCFSGLVVSQSATIADGDSYSMRITFTPNKIGMHQAAVVFRFDVYPDITVSLFGEQRSYPDDPWILYFVHETLNITCESGASICSGTAPFEVRAPVNNYCAGFANPLEFKNSVAQDIQMRFNPCNQIYFPDYPGNPSYSRVYEQRHGVCAEEDAAVCNIVARFDPDSFSVMGTECHLSGNLIFEISGQENVAQCSNLIVERERQSVDENGVPVFDENGNPVIETYDFKTGQSFRLTMSATAEFPTLGGESRSDNILVSVTRIDDDPVDSTVGLSYYNAFIDASEIDGKNLTIVLKFKDSSSQYVALPSNVTVMRVDWTVDEILAYSAPGFDGYTFDYLFDEARDEHIVRAILYGSFINKDGATINVAMNSNELRLYIPNQFSCPDGSTPTLKNIPPIIRPPEAPTRPIYSNVSGGDPTKRAPDYLNYTGGGDTAFVEDGFWHGGAARGGIWGSWVNDNTLRVGRKTYTFSAALPWEIYKICPVANIALPEPINGEIGTLPGASPGLFNACANPDNLQCPTEQDGMIAWYKTWSVYGWMCFKHICLLKMEDSPNPNAGEVWNCDE